MTESGPSKFTSQASGASTSSSAAPSPLPSRDPSPTRALSRTATSRASSANSGVRSRKNSTQDLSPSRSAKQANPGPAPKTLASGNTPSLLPSSSDLTSNAGPPVKSPTSMEHLRESPRWPVSPRLRSPPPILHKPNMGAPRRPDLETAYISAQRATPPVPGPSESDTEGEDLHMSAGMRTPRVPGSTSTLETVQEASPIGSPRGPEPSMEEKLDDSMVSEMSQADSIDFTLARHAAGRTTSANDSGSETDNSSTCIKQGVTKTKTGETSLQSMTVETETVTSIPQAPLVSGAGTQGSSVSLRTKPSTETIRPRKEKRKPARKQPTVTAGNASSKADIFEAKVASAVEEANSSDSEETFVYDSNPPDARDRPLRFHSRTPSATSMVSQIDRSGMRSIHSVMESVGPPMMVKKSMKFVNSSNSNNGSDSPFIDDDGRGTGRSNAGSARGTGRHPHHFGRWGRNGGGNSHPSLFAEQSPFNPSQAGNLGSRQSSGPPSPRFGNRASAGANGKRGTHLSAGYDLDDTTGADCSPSCSSSSSRPLTDIELVSMDHVVASQQELMLDLTIRAHNPNVVVVVVDSADIEVFAKSPHAMSDSEWWRHTHPGEIGPPPPKIIDKNPTILEADPGQPDDNTSPNMRLGTITGFDSALSFEGSFFHKGISYSSGEVRLKTPGNGTYGGQERWERIVEDEFQLILKGVLKYTLPLSQRVVLEE
ncbi:Vacuolar inheritance and morphology protein [Collariella sp. IMI 366227]|nr:Vacuolar inheritance and morphology protein [Collariella sp. IMI 366227]